MKSGCSELGGWGEGRNYAIVAFMKHTLFVLLAALALNAMAGDWQKHPANPVMGDPVRLGTCFDVNVIPGRTAKYDMYFSWRPNKAIALCSSADGIKWTEPEIVLSNDPTSGWEDNLNRGEGRKVPHVVHGPGAWLQQDRLRDLGRREALHTRRNFFTTLDYDGKLDDVCELHGYAPFYFRMPQPAQRPARAAPPAQRRRRESMTFFSFEIL